MRPFYFFVVVWGDTFIKYMTDYCVPSLLAPNNLPALPKNPNNKFIFCTTKDDWRKLQENVNFQNLANYIQPCFIEISLPPAGVSSCEHMGIGHKLATNMCFNDKAYGIALTPDLILSDGTIKNVAQHALNGKQIVYCAALRFEEEGIFAGLKALNLPQPLTVTGRQLVQIGVKAFHSQTLTYNFNSIIFAPNSPAAYWHVPSDGGVLVHSLSWCPLLLDYSVVEQHDTKALEEWTMDGDYVYKNFSNAEQIHLCQDSDEMMLISWAPKNYGPASLRPSLLRILFYPFKNFINKAFLRIALCNDLYDPMKVAIFKQPVYWHINDLSSEWDTLEAKIAHIVHPKKNILGKFSNFLYTKLSRPLGYIKIINDAILGDANAKFKIKRKLYILLKLELTGT